MLASRLHLSALLRALLLPAALLLFAIPVSVDADDSIPESVVDVRIEGCETVPQSWILGKIRIQPRRPLTSRMVREDKRELMNTRLFYSVVERFERTPAGAVLIFRVQEKPIVRSVRFEGNRRIKDKLLTAWTGLRPGSPFDDMANREAVRRIEQEYKEKGFFFVQVTLVQGADPADRDIVIRVDEGPKVRVVRRDFMGVEQVMKGRLKTKLVTKSAILGLFSGIYRPETLEQDVLALKEYYRGLGFFDADIRVEPYFSEDRSGVRIIYTVEEGVRSRVRSIELRGNRVIGTAQLCEKARVKEGDFFNGVLLSRDVRDMLEPYWERGHYLASVVPVPQFSEQPGIVDVVFEIDEDRPRYIRRVTADFAGEHPYTKETVVLDRFQMHPGDLANPKLIRRGQSRMNGGAILQGVQLTVTPVDPETEMFAPGNRTFRAQQKMPQSGWQSDWTDQLSTFGRRRLADDAYGRQRPVVATKKSADSGAAASSDGSSSDEGAHRVGRSQRGMLPVRVPAEGRRDLSHLHRTAVPLVPPWRPVPSETVVHGFESDLLVSRFPASAVEPVTRAQNHDGFFYHDSNEIRRGNPALEGSPYNNQFQSLPPGWVDIDIGATEGRTGRIMMGAGVNSDAGIIGSFIWEETNFDLFAPPRSFSDIINGRAYRGGGQRFRAEAAPGDIVSRYAISWTDPYFLYSDYVFSVSGFYYNRFLWDWDEDRVGGRISLGRQVTPEFSVNAALRLEEVTLKNPRAPMGGVPAVVARSVGTSFLSTTRLSASNDTRDSVILPGEGHFMEVAYEQAFGDFHYPRFEGEARQYFTLYNRPDESGRQILMLAGNLGFSGNNTPVFERYYAGGFQSFRGFAYRGVTPRINGVSIGGRFQALGTVEYRVPVTADDMIQFVVFSDVGTVDTQVSFARTRATVGVGLRIIVPAMGQVPLAFDFGVPVAKEFFDDERIFSFYVGILQ